MSKYNYLLKKIRETDFSTKPFKHLYIENFFNEKDFSDIINSPQINLPVVNSDRELYNSLKKNGYGIISFPGTSTNFNEYESWHKSKKDSNLASETTTSFGIVFRLEKPESSIKELFDFIGSDIFNNTISEKFEIDQSSLTSDNGIQKYLDGYEISPHPDIKKKALTFMVNINPNYKNQEYNTHYLKFKDKWKYVQEFWKYNDNFDRCWVPWDWCKTEKIQKANNSIVIFSPSEETMHAIRANYDHFTSQRTQLYGNLWYDEINITNKPEWENYVIKENDQSNRKITSLRELSRKIKNRFSRKKITKRNI
jgi:hypothetical protein